ncbi:L-threonylcarbamoyladenylate synthase [Pseudobdellovibrio exovorus]|uniref:Threonylcarbamoyl-AMP synthase n=1 Tax=Pseudobdellovibrio exovorus JSS TaxID=1184267 RepID=M4VAZ8_9BACT|nr:L-threonylcarbamoyladenylate synthase [Pseudobdellovibrio exovorus]AGH96393.1 putative translation factor related to Sua5 [Pseudobdellovibrio exovorus JSS]
MKKEMSEQLDQAVNLILKNEVVAMPTETVYGLAARIDSEVAIKKIFSVKKRPFFDPLIVHVSSVQQAQSCVQQWHAMCDLLVKKFWPGPLTLVMPKSPLISDLITSGLPNVGLRWPAHPVAQSLISRVGVPLAAPSANLFGRTSPTAAQHVRDEFQNKVFVLDGDSSQIGIESTVLLVKNIDARYELSILRKGAILQSQIEQALADSDLTYQWVESVDKKESPGHMKHHYMPQVPLVVCRNSRMKLSDLTSHLNQKLKELPDEVEGVKIVKPKQPISKIEFLKLSDDPAQAARELYSQLRAASQRMPDALCFIQMPHHQGEMWESVFDRLYKAASLILD